MSGVEIEPQQIADFDQAWAASEELLVNLVASYVVRRKEDAAEDCPKELTIMSMVDSLASYWDREQVIAALAVATAMIAESMEASGGSASAS